MIAPTKLDLGHLSLFVGMRINARVLSDLRGAGFEKVRESHGYVFQHLIAGPRTVTELAGLLDVTQQAASKQVTELVTLGYLKDVASTDGRARCVALSPKALRCIRKARALRAKEERQLEKRYGARAIATSRALLADILVTLGGAHDVRHRRIRAPR